MDVVRVWVISLERLRDGESDGDSLLDGSLEGVSVADGSLLGVKVCEGVMVSSRENVTDALISFVREAEMDRLSENVSDALRVFETSAVKVSDWLNVAVAVSSRDKLSESERE